MSPPPGSFHNLPDRANREIGFSYIRYTVEVYLSTDCSSARWSPGQRVDSLAKAHQSVRSDECEPVSVAPTYPMQLSGRQKAAPVGESGGAGQLVVVSALEVALRWKVVVDQGMN